MAYILPQVKIAFPDISYGIYIFHMPIITFMFLKMHNNNLMLGIFLVAAASTLSWYLVEKPFLAMKNKIVKPDKQELIPALNFEAD